jgi:hypothetical protein
LIKDRQGLGMLAFQLIQQRHKYYVKIMKSIPHCQTIEDYEALLPWNVDIEKVNSQ